MSQSAKRTYRWLGALALAHALLVSLLIICFFDAFHQPSLARCWFALATLWFLSPIVLILHRGRSWRGCFGFFVGSTLLLLPSFTEYFVGTGPWVLGLPLPSNLSRSAFHNIAGRGGRAAFKQKATSRRASWQEKFMALAGAVLRRIFCASGITFKRAPWQDVSSMRRSLVMRRATTQSLTQKSNDGLGERASKQPRQRDLP